MFIGDSTTDVLAGLLGGVAVIGYANKPGKAEALSQTGARAVVTDLAEITTALRTAPSPALMPLCQADGGSGPEGVDEQGV